MVMEDPKALHHLLLLRNFMSQGLVHDRHLLYASPFKDPGAFLGTLPNPISPKDNKKVSRPVDPDQEKGLRIAWQYMKYFGENHQNVDNHKGWWYWICWSYSHTVVMCSTCGYSDMVAAFGRYLTLSESSSRQGHGKTSHWLSGHGWLSSCAQSKPDQHSGTWKRFFNLSFSFIPGPWSNMLSWEDTEISRVSYSSTGSIKHGL